MTRLQAVLMICFLIISASAGYIGFDAYRSGLIPFIPSPIQTACRSMIRERLKAPSTLRVISSQQLFSPLPAEEFANYFRETDPVDNGNEDIIKFRVEMALSNMAKGKPGPSRYEVIETYDAENALGTPLRGSSHCVVSKHDGAYPTSFDLEYLLRLDGFDRTGWLEKQIKNLE